MTDSFENLGPNERKAQAEACLTYARQELKRNERRNARRYAEQAASLAPDHEDAWLILAAIASPRASVAYLQRALEINPSSQRAQKGMQWALSRMERAQSAPAPVPEPVQSEKDVPAGPAPAGPYPIGLSPAEQIAALPVKTPPQTRKRTVVPVRASSRKRRIVIPTVFIYAFGILCLSMTAFAVSLIPYYPPAIAALPPEIQAQVPYFSTIAAFQLTQTPGTNPTSQPGTELAGLVAVGPGDTATPESSSEPTLMPTSSPTSGITEIPTDTPMQPASETPAPSETPVPTETPLPTETPTLIPTIAPTATLVPPSPTSAPQPTKKPKKKAVAASPGFRPEDVSLNDRWVDVDLSAQTTYAMQGDQIMKSFTVSTGRWPTVTVTGVYKIYVKYRTADMSGDDYFLPDVPYVMYFFKGYGIHGTYWHNNFGTPMSHGCVNLSPNDAAWLFDFASVGTIVSVHE